MKHISTFQLFESKKEKKTKVEELIEKFKKKYDTDIDPDFSVRQIKFIEKAFAYYDTKWIKGKVDKIVLKDLGGVHGRWSDRPKLKQMTLNSSIFDFKRKFKHDDIEIPYAIFTIVHEIAHCVDYQLRVSFSKEWQSISGWKKLDRKKSVPDDYIRYVEKRPGREIAGPKRSNWIHKKDAEFIRKYTSRNPREEFADSLAFGILGFWNKFTGEGGERKKEIIKKILKKVD